MEKVKDALNIIPGAIVDYYSQLCYDIPVAGEHDKRYKKLFSHPAIVKELLLYFIDEAFIKNLDFTTLQRMDISFITDLM